MYLLEAFRSALRSLWAAKMRSFLAVLGVVIGTSAVIIMMSMGKGAEQRVTQSISSLGTNLLFIYPGVKQSRIGFAKQQVDSLTIEDLQAITQVEHVEHVVPDFSRWSQVKYKERNESVNITGTYPEYQYVRQYYPAVGRFFDRRDDAGRRRVCVLGHRIAQQLFGDETPVGKYVKINRQNFLVLGVMEEKGSQGSWVDFDWMIYIPCNTALAQFGDRQRRLRQILVSVDDKANIEFAKENMDAMLRRRHGLKPDEEPDYSIGSQAELMRSMGEVVGAFTVLLSGIALVSLLVGGIGIMNIMLVSVAERTREIGIRKAIGARRRDILRQFLIESVVISVSGGAIGILLGIVGSLGLVSVISQSFSGGEGWEPHIPLESILLAFGFSFLVGVFFGVYPAHKASKLHPVEALRYE